MSEFFDADRATKIDYWTTQRTVAACALRVANERLGELGVIEPLREVERPDENQLRLVGPEGNEAA